MCTIFFTSKKTSKIFKKKKKPHRMWPAVEKMHVSMVLVLNKEGGSLENWRWTLNEDLG